MFAIWPSHNILLCSTVAILPIRNRPIVTRRHTLTTGSIHGKLYPEFTASAS